jgi:hypothetical protein
MKRLLLLIGIVATTVAFATISSPAKAGDFGLHFAGPGYHIDVGRAHYAPSYYGGYSGYRSVGYGYGGRDYYGGHSDWHDTSHYDYHPGEVVRHRNHYHYVPGHYDYHETGHWDHHGW